MLTQDRAAQDQVADDKLIALANPPFPATQLPFAMPDMGQAEGIAPNMVRPGYISGNAPINMGVVPEAEGTNALQAQREELAYNVQGGRAGPQTALPTSDMGLNILSGTVNIDAEGNISVDYPEEPSDMASMMRLGPAPNRSGLNLTDEPAAVDEAITAAAQDKAADTKLAGLAAAKTAADAKAKTAAEEATAAAGTGETGGAGGAGGMSSYEQELMNVLQKREKAAEQDKWLSLAQVGMSLMSSTNPTLGGALGEAGLKGVEAARGARDQYDKDRLELLGALEQSRMARASAAAKSAQGGASMGLSAGMGRLLTQIDSDITRLDTIVSDAALNPPTTPEGEMQLAQVQADLRSKLALKDSLLYGTAAPSEDAGGIANLSDE